MTAKRGGDETVAAPSRVARKRAERMSLILKIATQVFAEKGYERTNLEEIAARVDMRGPSLYHYVDTKEELYLRCVENIGEEVFARLERLAATDAGPAERLRLMFREQLLTQLRDYYPDYVPMVVTNEPSLRPRVRAIRHRHIGIFAKVAAEAASAGELAGEDWRLGLRLAFGALGFIHEWYRPEGPMSPEALAEAIAERFMRMMGAYEAVGRPASGPPRPMPGSDPGIHDRRVKAGGYELPKESGRDLTHKGRKHK